MVTKMERVNMAFPIQQISGSCCNFSAVASNSSALCFSFKLNVNFMYLLTHLEVWYLFSSPFVTGNSWFSSCSTALNDFQIILLINQFVGYACELWFNIEEKEAKQAAWYIWRFLVPSSLCLKWAQTLDIWARSNARPGYPSNGYCKSSGTSCFYLLSSFIGIWFGFL